MKRFLSMFLILCCTLIYGGASYAVTVPANTSIFIRPNETISSKNIDVGEIAATVTNDVVVNNIVVFKAGSEAVLTISDVEKARCWGNPGKLTVNNGWVYDSRGNKQKVLFAKNYVGEEKNWPKVMGGISIFFLWPLAFFGFVHGGQAKVLSTKEIETHLTSQYNF